MTPVIIRWQRRGDQYPCMAVHFGMAAAKNARAHLEALRADNSVIWCEEDA